MTFSIKLTGFTGGTLDLTGNDPYYINAPGWKPAVASLQDSAALYSDVVEKIPLMIVADTEANALDALHDLVSALDQAVRWKNGEIADPVLMQIEIVGSSNPLKAAVLGPADDKSWVGLSPSFRRDIGAYAISPVDVSLIRRGEWLGAEDTVTPVAGNPGDVISLTFSETLQLTSPTKIFFDDITPVTGSEAHPRGFLIVCDSNYISKVQAESAGLSQFSSVADAANLASGGSIAQSTTFSGFLSLVFSSTVQASSRVGVFCVARVDAANTEWKIVYTADHQRGVYVESRPVFFSSTRPEVLYLGSISNNETYRIGSVRIQCERISGTGSLSFDYFVGVDVANASFSAIQLLEDSAGLGGGSDRRFLFDHSLLERPEPYIVRSLETGSFPVVLSYRGLNRIYTRHTNISVMGMFVGGDSGSRWRYAINGAVENFTANAVRRPVFLTPR